MSESFDVISFEDAIALEPDQKKRHLLLGNGFSRAWRDDVFAYGALYEQANFERLHAHGRRAFDLLQTQNFETVMRGLQVAAKILEEYLPGRQDVITILRRDAAALKEVLVQTLGGGIRAVRRRSPRRSTGTLAAFCRGSTTSTHSTMTSCCTGRSCRRRFCRT